MPRKSILDLPTQPERIEVPRQLLARALGELSGGCPWCLAALSASTHAPDCPFPQLQRLLTGQPSAYQATLISSGVTYTVLGRAKHKHGGVSWIHTVHYMCVLGKLYSRGRSNFEREFKMEHTAT